METLQRAGVRLAYEQTGVGEPTLLFGHGWCCDHTFLAPQVAHFRQRHRCLAVDLRGHGASDRPVQDYSIGVFADDLAWLCDALGIGRAVVVGHSMGGIVGVELAARRPDLAAAVVALDAPILPVPRATESALRIAAAFRGPNYRAAQREYVSRYLFLPTDDPERKARVLEVMGRAPQHVLASAFEGMFTWDGQTALAACKAPLLLISAARPAADLARIRALCPQVVHGQTVGAGHFHQLEVPEQVNPMIARFLAITPLGPAAR